MKQIEKEDKQLYRFALILFTGFLFFGGLYFARDFLIPVSIAALMAMVMLPINRRLESWGLARSIAIIICIIIIILIVAGFTFFFYIQLEDLIQDLPSIRAKLDQQLDDFQLLIEEKTGISQERQISFLRNQSATFLNFTSRYIRNMLMTATETLAEIGLATIYLFFFLYYRDKFENFLLKMIDESNNRRVKSIVSNISKVTQQYLGGKLIITIILSFYNTAGLKIIGFEDAIFWGIFGGILNFIPYIGTFLGGFIPFLLALVTYDSFGTPLAVALIFMSGQFFDNNFLTPIIVGSKVDLNPLFTIMALIIGGLLWGVAGLIIFIPLLGIAKVIFDNVSSLHPYGYLIGDTNKQFGLMIIKKIKNVFQ